MKVLPLLVLPIFLLVTSCTSVRSKQLVGKTKVDLSQTDEKNSLSAIAGVWVDLDGDTSPISVVNAKEGELLCGSTDDDNSIKLSLRKTGEHLFVNFPPNEEGERMWLMMKIQGKTEELIFWAPDVDRFRELIAEGKIKGVNDPETRVDKKGKERKNKSPGAVIDDPSGEWVEKMIAGEYGVLFKWQDPLVLRKKVDDKDAAEAKDSTEED